ncbi:MAG TPA: hypothetical protein VGK99_06340 [Acidobacteriota bacterium]
MGIADADSAEHGQGSNNLVIYPVVCAVQQRPAGAPKLSGGLRVHIEPKSIARLIYKSHDVEEEFFCNYEVNPAYESRRQDAGLRFSARGGQGEVRAAELANHRFFLATLFQPQLSSTAENPHPVVMAFVKAAAEFSRMRISEWEMRNGE